MIVFEIRKNLALPRSRLSPQKQSAMNQDSKTMNSDSKIVEQPLKKIRLGAQAQKRGRRAKEPEEEVKHFIRRKRVFTAEELFNQRVRKGLKSVARDYSAEAFSFLLNTMRDDDVAMQHRMNAATQILDRGWGKPAQHNEVSVSVLDNLSDQELIKIITGVEIEGEVIEQARRGLTYDDPGENDEEQ